MALIVPAVPFQRSSVPVKATPVFAGAG